MNFEQMKLIEPSLARLEQSAHNAGQHQADWMATLLAVHETLTKCCGSGAMHEELQTATAYEVARSAIFAAWSRGSKGKPAEPEVEPTTYPWQSGFDDESEQSEMFDTSEAYQ